LAKIKNLTRTQLINPALGEDVRPQGLKPNVYAALTAQLKLCPFKTIYEMTFTKKYWLD